MGILIADDHPLTLMGTKQFVESLGYTVASVCNNGINAYSQIILNKYEIAILDIDMPGMDGLEILETVFKLKLKTKIILLTMHQETSYFKKANDFGVFGYVLKSYSEVELGICLEAVSKGNYYVSPMISKELYVDEEGYKDDALSNLTNTENKVLKLVAKQLTNKQIAEILFVSERTVEGHRRNIIEKLGLPKVKNVLLKWVSNRE